MKQDNTARTLIEQNLQQFATRGVTRKAGDVEAHLEYRQTLSDAEKQMFDALLREGSYAGSAAELVELSAGREDREREPVGASVA